MNRHRVLAIGAAAVALLGLAPSPSVSAKSARTYYVSA